MTHAMIVKNTASLCEIPPLFACLVSLGWSMAQDYNQDCEFVSTPELLQVEKHNSA